MGKYRINSNLESGFGKSDLILEPTQIKQPAIIIELKVTKEIEDLEQKCKEALEQIEIKQYDTFLRKRGFSAALKYGISFCGKMCLVKKK